MKKLFFLSLIGLLLCAVSVSAAPYTGSDIELLGKAYSDAEAIGGTFQSGGNEWYVEGNSVWTAWSNIWIEYTATLYDGTWNIGINAINHGNLGSSSSWYAEFKIGTDLNGIFSIPASDEEENAGYFAADIEGVQDVTVRFEWLNDQYKPPLDANIQINSVFFDNTATAPVPEPATLILLGSGLLSLVAIGKRKLK